MRKLLVVSLVLLAGVALAFTLDPTSNVTVTAEDKPLKIVEGFYLGTAGIITTLNKMASHQCGGGDYDFPALGGALSAATTVCANSAALTAAGCGFGDRVTLGIDQAPPSAFGQITAFVSATNAVKVTVCANGIMDGGSFDMPDASYTICCDGND